MKRSMKLILALMLSVLCAFFFCLGCDGWTLQNDVTIKAEDIRFYMNGHTIDLNGHELRIYAYAGSDLVITDAGNYDEGRFAIVDSKKDTEDAGRLVLLTNGGDVNVGSIGIDCAKFISDKSDLYTIDHSIEEGDKMYDFD